MKALVETKALAQRYGHDIELRVWGTPENVEEWWQGYIKSYHPLGYDTKITKDTTVDGVRTIETSRSHTCD